jgi:serine/threonine-protein kinase
MLRRVSSPLETIERAIVFENASGARRISAQVCVSECVSQFDYALLQVDLGLHAGTRTLYVVLRLREDRFTDTSHARIVAAAQEAEARVVALSELDYQERGHFLTGFSACTQQQLGLMPEDVPAAVEALLADPVPAVQERRATPRREVQAPALVTMGAQKVPGTLENISRGGALVRTTPPPVLQAKVELEVQLPDGPVHAQATVVNLTARGAGLQFTQALPETKLEAAVVDVRVPERVGNYELLSLLGQGGTGEVHFARVLDGPQKGEHVALKRLHQRRAHDAEAIKQFEAEARTLSLVKHANIVRTLESGVLDGQRFLVMEAIDGRDLGQVLRRCRARKKPLPVELACFTVKTLLEALSAVHEAKEEGQALGLVHGDVSPHNLYISKKGAIKLGDFGLAKRAGKGVAHRVEQGRPTYLSPEMLDGDLSPAADLWAAAVTLYELLTLQQPFSGNDLAELTHAIRHTRERPIRELRDDCSGPLQAVLRTALEKDPALRFQTAREFAAALTPHYHLVRAPLSLPRVLAELFAT